MTETSIREMALAAREAAIGVMRRHQKHASVELYRVLAQCMTLCIAVARSNTARDELRALIAESAGDKDRAYIQLSSDAYGVACRYVFDGDESRANISRYAHALREAGKMGLDGETVFTHLKDNGGVNALYLRRPLAARTVAAKLIRLDRTITFPKVGYFTMTLERNGDGSFNVIEEPQIVSSPT